MEDANEAVKPLWYGVRRWDADRVPHNPPVMSKPITVTVTRTGG
jgi:hypothetical protein